MNTRRENDFDNFYCKSVLVFFIFFLLISFIQLRFYGAPHMHDMMTTVCIQIYLEA